MMRVKILLNEGLVLIYFTIHLIVPIIIKYLKLLLLWSGVMIPNFRYGDKIDSSAAVESSFKKLKILRFKNIVLP